jgi:hypothetical protein
MLSVMNQLPKITRAETICAEQNWRQSGGGRVLTFDLMLEIPQSRKVSGIECHSQIVFEDQRYTVDQKEVVRAFPEVVRLVLSRIGLGREPHKVKVRQHLPATSSSSHVNTSPVRS